MIVSMTGFGDATTERDGTHSIAGDDDHFYAAGEHQFGIFARIAPNGLAGLCRPPQDY